MKLVLMFLAAGIGIFPATAADKAAPEDPAMPVRYSEGVVHGYLVLSTLDGAPLAHGELLQSARDGDVKGRMVFRFKDGSVSEETTEFTQRGVFSLKSYHQVQRGPAFPRDLDYRIERVSAKAGRYQVKTKDHKDGKTEEEAGTFDMPADLYNGMVIVVTKNIPPGAGRTLHMLALTPKPRLIEVGIRPAGSVKLTHGGIDESATHYVLDPKLGAVLGTLAKVAGKDPPDQHLWMATGEAPGFVRHEGPMFQDGPVWRISLTAPCFAAGSETCSSAR
jgi:hypothetical protein